MRSIYSFESGSQTQKRLLSDSMSLDEDSDDPEIQSFLEMTPCESMLDTKRILTIESDEKGSI